MCIVAPVLGTQPPGQMKKTHYPYKLAGHEKDSKGCWAIDFSIPNGKQGTHHPHPGVPYQGTERRAWSDLYTLHSLIPYYVTRHDTD